MNPAPLISLVSAAAFLLAVLVAPLPAEAQSAGKIARDIGTVLAVMHPDVLWPNGMEGGPVAGDAAVRAYWTRQWALIDPRWNRGASRSRPTGGSRGPCTSSCAISPGPCSREATVEHVYAFEDGLIKSMEIRS